LILWKREAGIHWANPFDIPEMDGAWRRRGSSRGPAGPPRPPEIHCAKFEHDTARSVNSYAAPQLHTHAVIFNVTEREDGSTRALQPQSFFDSQQFATAVYQSALTYRLRNLAYEIEAGKSDAPEIKGYSQEYLDASSPRSQQIKEHLERTGHSGAEAAQIAAHATRDRKQILTSEQVLAAHKAITEPFGNEAATVVAQARERAQSQVRNRESLAEEAIKAKEAVGYARSSNFEQEAVVDESFLNSAQRTVIQEVLTSPDRIHGLQGLAGTGKTTVLSSIREGAEQSGYAIEGLAPTSRAAAHLREAGISATILQSFLARGSQGQVEGDPASRHLYLLDESNLASTKQMRTFLDKIRPQDRVLVIGDTRQHQCVDAGRPFEQMQDAGMRTSQLDQIMRQKDPELLNAVLHLATGKTEEGVRLLGEQGRVTEVRDGNDRIAAIAKDYVARPENTIIVSPDNRSRQAINQAVRTELHATGALADDDREFRTLTHRSDMTGADREWAARYQAGNILKYTSGSKLHGIERESSARVISTNGRDNTLTVEREDGQTVTYDPKRLKGANVYQEVTREFATGDRIRFTAPDKQLEVNNRDLATIVKLEGGQITVQMDTKGGRFVTFDPAKMRSFDHGYAVTSHSSQGLTEGRVIANIDTDSSRSLINTRLAYVAISRASEDARIYTNDGEALGTRLATEISKTAAVDFRQPKAEVERASPEPTVHQYDNPDHRLAAVALAYAERPDSTIVVAPDQAERDELNRLIRSGLQAQGRIAPDSRSIVVHIEHPLSNPKVAAQYTPGDLIQYRQGSPTIDGIPQNSIGTVVSVDAKTNSLTVQTPSGDEATYNPHLTKTMTAESTVYRQAHGEIAPGDRIQFTEADSARGIRKGELGTVTAISDANGLDVKLDKGTVVQLNSEQARHIEHGYAVESFRPVAPERVLFTQKATVHEREAALLSRHGRELSLFTSEGSVSNNQGRLDQIALPQQHQIEAPANVIAPEPVQNEIRRSLGR
jgi:ATP-dependent exoDNAse (exonuclease V) alpha subunit